MAKQTKKSASGKSALWSYLMPAGAMLAVIAVGVGSYYVSADRTKQASIRETQLPSDLTDLKPVDDIRALASVGLVEGVSISSVELENEEGVLVYKVKYSDGTYKLYDARSGEMVAKSDLEIDESVPADFVASVSIDQARSTAQGVFPSKVITKIELETENGIVVYSVRFSDGSRVDVSASDGSVVRTRDETAGTRSGSDDDDDDSDESDDHDSDDSSNDSDDNHVDDSGKSSNSGSGSSRDESADD